MLSIVGNVRRARLRGPGVRERRFLVGVRPLPSLEPFYYDCGKREKCSRNVTVIEFWCATSGLCALVYFRFSRFWWSELFKLKFLASFLHFITESCYAFAYSILIAFLASSAKVVEDDFHVRRDYRIGGYGSNVCKKT
jgi:hypothetical protein